DPFITQGISADFCLDRPKPGEDPRKGRAGVGIAFLNDRSASPAFRTTEFQASLAYRLSIDGYSSIAAGLQAGLRQHSLAAPDGRRASPYTGQYYDASLSTGESFDRGTRTRPDVGAGVAYSFRLRQDRRGSGELAFKTGIAVFHAARPDLSLIEGNGGQVERRYSGFFEGTVGLGRSKLQLRPSAFLNMQGGTMRSLGGIMVEKIFGGRGEFLAPEHSPTLGLGAFVRDGRSVVAA